MAPEALPLPLMDTVAGHFTSLDVGSFVSKTGLPTVASKSLHLESSRRFTPISRFPTGILLSYMIIGMYSQQNMIWGLPVIDNIRLREIGQGRWLCEGMERSACVSKPGHILQTH